MMALEAVRELAETWLEEAELLRKYGAEAAASAAELHARQLVGRLEASEKELLTLAQAAKESGYSQDHLRHLVADGTLPNAGEKGRPRIRRADLPVKPGTTRSPTGGTDAETDAREILRAVGG